MANAKFKLLPVIDITLDLENPRIAEWIQIYKETPSADQIFLALGVGESTTEGGTSFLSLKESIRTNKGIIHPIIVNRKGEGKLTVIEGNTRVAIYIDFLKDKAAGKWDLIPAMVYDNLSQDKIDAIRLQAHLVGPREWKPYSKAKYLSMLREKENLTFAQIVDFCGGKRQEVESYIAAYKNMEKYYRPLCDEEKIDPSRFSAFVEIQKPRVLSALSKAGFSVSDFSKWIIDRKFRRLENVRRLPEILANDKAKAIFLSKKAEDALKIIDVPTPDTSLEDASLADLSREIINRIMNGIDLAKIKELKENPDSTEYDLISSAKDSLEFLYKQIKDEE